MSYRLALVNHAKGSAGGSYSSLSGMLHCPGPGYLAVACMQSGGDDLPVAWHYQHKPTGTCRWATLTRNPGTKTLGEAFAGDTERGEIAEQLTTAFVGGYLTPEEFQERHDRALSARRLGDFDGILTGLEHVPAAPPTLRLAAPQPPQKPPNSSLRHVLFECMVLAGGAALLAALIVAVVVSL